MASKPSSASFTAESSGIIPTYYTSRKPSVVTSDEGKGNQQLIIQPTATATATVTLQKQRRTKRKRIPTVYYSDTHIHHAFQTSTNSRDETAEPTDDDSSSSSSSVMKRAEELQANLPKEYPSFLKLMLHSHVSKGFWLHLPSKFCKVHLPKCDRMMDLIDEHGMKFECSYLFHKLALSGGWRGFSLHHELSKGDVLVFQLLALTTFKVFIVRKDGQDEFQGGLRLLTWGDYRENEVSSEKGDDDNQIQTVSVPKNINPRKSESESSSDDNNNIECDVSFETIKSFDNFCIVVDGLVVDSKFSDTTRKKYYELCCSQKSFLHEHLLKGLNCNLVIGMIMEIINIADGLRACASSTSIKDLRIWEKTLKGFELIGMKVDFLHAKVITLQKCMEERDCVARNVTCLENKLEKLKSRMQKVNFEIEAKVSARAQKLQSKLRKIANAPW